MTWLLTVVVCVKTACMPLMPVEAGASREQCYSAAARQIVYWAAYDATVKDFDCRPKGRYDR